MAAPTNIQKHKEKKLKINMTRVMIAVMIKTNKYNKMAKVPLMELYRLEHKTKRTPRWGSRPFYLFWLSYVSHGSKKKMQVFAQQQQQHHHLGNHFPFRNPTPKTTIHHCRWSHIPFTTPGSIKIPVRSIEISNKTKNQTTNTNAFLYWESKQMKNIEKQEEYH